MTTLLLGYTPKNKIEPKYGISLTSPYEDSNRMRRINLTMMSLLALGLVMAETPEQRELFEQVFDNNLHKVL